MCPAPREPPTPPPTTIPPPDPAGHIMPLLTPRMPEGILPRQARTTPSASPGRTCSGAATAHFWHRRPGRDGRAFALPAAGSRAKRNLFDSRPLFHLTRAPTRRPEVSIGFAFANPDGDQELSALFGMLQAKAGGRTQGAGKQARAVLEDGNGAQVDRNVALPQTSPGHPPLPVPPLESGRNRGQADRFDIR